MNIQSINPTQEKTNTSFKKLIVKSGSFDALKNCKSFPIETYRNETPLMLNFYKDLLQIKKKCETNTLYNVVIKPTETSGKIIVEDNLGTEQDGLSRTFEELTNIPLYKPRKEFTKEDVKNPFIRSIKNFLIRRQNKNLSKHTVDFQKYLDIIKKHIKESVNSADYLMERNIARSHQDI